MQPGFRNLSALLLAFSGIAFAQTPLAFEAASIRSSSGGVFSIPGGAHLFRISGNRVVENAVTLTDLIADAYDVKPHQISGQLRAGEFFDLAATTGGEGTPTPAQIRLMLQTLLADRFQLKLHRETRNLPIYELTIGKNGPKLKEVASDPKAPSFDSMGLLDAFISNFLDRPLVDKTGLTGEHYQYNWDQTELFEELKQGKPVPSIFSAVQDQLGLKLEPKNALTDFLVVDHSEKPSAN
jgi:uncharacterized protein (TIGR03435 family)